VEGDKRTSQSSACKERDITGKIQLRTGKGRHRLKNGGTEDHQMRREVITKEFEAKRGKAHVLVRDGDITLIASEERGERDH